MFSSTVCGMLQVCAAGAGGRSQDEWRQVVTDSQLIYSVPVVQCSCLRPSGIFTSLLARRTKPVSEEPFLYKVHVIGMQGRNVNHVYFTIGAERIRYKFIGLICQWTLIPRPNIAASRERWTVTRHSTLPSSSLTLTTLDSYSFWFYLFTADSTNKSHSNRWHMYV